MYRILESSGGLNDNSTNNMNRVNNVSVHIIINTHQQELHTQSINQPTKNSP